MTLDLDELTRGWDCPPGELRARMVVGRDGQEQLQLRIDLGLMQMLPHGRPDGERYHGLPTVYDYIRHELLVGGSALTQADWQELQRELLQTNYRRLGYSALAEEALKSNNADHARSCIAATIADIDICLADLQLLIDQQAVGDTPLALRPTLLFERGRWLAQLRVVEGQFEEAIEQAEAAADRLDECLSEWGCDEEVREQDPGVRYLRDLGRQLRLEYGVSQTLRERLEEALEREDFETAAELRDALHRRGQAAADTGGKPSKP